MEVHRPDAIVRLLEADPLLGERLAHEEGRVLDGSGEVIEAFRVRTTQSALSSRLSGYPPSRVVLEGAPTRRG